MHIRVYGVQADELAAYEKAEGKYGFTFEFAEAPLNEDTVDQVHNCDGIILVTTCNVTEKVVKELAERGVKYLATRSAGSDHVDYDAVVKYGLHCANVPFYAPEAIAEHTILMALWVLRHGKKSYEMVKSGDFTMKGLKGRQLGQLTAGVLGTGRIGRTTMTLLNGFGTKVLGWDPYPNAAAEKLGTYVSKEELFAQSDIVFLHCPLTDDSYHLICDETLALMKPGAVLVNTARGGLVDHAAVLKALENGKLSGFAFDVYENEAEFVRKKLPVDQISDPVFKALFQREDTAYSAHVAFYTDGAINSMIEVTLDNLKEYETTGQCRNEIKVEGGAV
ncbi:NAD(P)-dependent oxidoreductase [Oscillibacter ruminantium]|uniref:NAD(P)-dependent oxidoreductase n=1 Tax=Oscillibacter ruminantium TaxID=1263547 RepID=UPI00331E9429